MHLQENIKSLGRNVLEFFCGPLYTNYLPDLHKKLQTTSICKTNAVY